MRFYAKTCGNYGFWIYFSNLPILPLHNPMTIWYNLGYSGEGNINPQLGRTDGEKKTI
jgi:hypothetical protein